MINSIISSFNSLVMAASRAGGRVPSKMGSLGSSLFGYFLSRKVEQVPSKATKAGKTEGDGPQDFAFPKNSQKSLNKVAKVPSLLEVKHTKNLAELEIISSALENKQAAENFLKTKDPSRKDFSSETGIWNKADYLLNEGNRAFEQRNYVGAKDYYQRVNDLQAALKKRRGKIADAIETAKAQKSLESQSKKKSRLAIKYKKLQEQKELEKQDEDPGSNAVVNYIAASNV